MERKHKDIITKTFFSLLPVQMIMVATGSINSIIDGAVATNYIAPDAMVSIALFFPIIKLMDALNIMLLGGSQILCGRFMGKNQYKRSVQIFSLDMLCVTGIGLLLSIFCTVFSRGLAGLLVSDSGMLEGLCDYMRGYAPGLVAYLLISQLTAFLQIEKQEKRTYIGMGIMILSNITLDILFVSVMHKGLFGLGLATSISNAVYVAIMASYYLSKNTVMRVTFSGLSIKDLWEISKIGASGALGQLGQAVRGTILNILMLTYAGASGVASFAAVNAFGCVFYAATAGIASATLLLASVYSGEEDRTGLIQIMKTAVWRGTGLVCIIALVLIGLSGVMTSIFYGPDAGEVYSMTRIGFLLFPITMPLSCLCCVFSNYHQCRNHLGIVNILSLVDGVAGVLLFSVLLAPTFGMTGIWSAHICSGVITVLLVIGYSWMKKKSAPRSIEDLLVLEDGFGAAASDRIDLTVTDMTGVVLLSEQVMNFCAAHQVDQKRSYYAGLCVEEMAGNIVEHGFEPEKAHSIDIRVIYAPDGLLLRLKDDCKPFNPKEVQIIFEPEDITHNIGLRLVSGIAKGMQYQNCFCLNVTTIEI